jgi:hypothetical protein
MPTTVWPQRNNLKASSPFRSFEQAQVPRTWLIWCWSTGLGSFGKTALQIEQ